MKYCVVIVIGHRKKDLPGTLRCIVGPFMYAMMYI